MHLTKDVGMIPYSLHQKHGYESTLACYENGSYPYLREEVAGLQLVHIKKIFKNRFLDGLWFVWRNRKNFDALQTYHLRFSSLFWLFAFRLFAPGHKTYLKLDASEQILTYRFKGIGGKINKMLLRFADIVSVESIFLQRRLTEQWGRHVVCIPNGCTPAVVPVQYRNKRQLILSTGMIGLPKKRHELLLEAFADFAPAFPQWNLQLSGAIETPFEAYIASYFRRHPGLRGRVHFTGMISDRKELAAQYAAAKIFCLCSENEGFPLALLEAAAGGCFLVTSAMPAATDITANETYGRILPRDDAATLTALLLQLAADEAAIARNVGALQAYTAQHFSWAVIAASIHHHIRTPEGSGR